MSKKKFPFEIQKKKPKIVIYPSRPYYTAYFITISTNYRPKTQTEAKRISKALDESIDEVFTDKFDKIIRFPNPQFPHDLSKIFNVSYEGLVEIGGDKRGRRVHWHGILKIIHSSVIQLFREDLKPIAEKIIKARIPEVKGIYVQKSFVKSIEPIEDYVNKSEISKYNFDKLQSEGHFGGGAKAFTMVKGKEEDSDTSSSSSDSESEEDLDDLRSKMNKLGI